MKKMFAGSKEELLKRAEKINRKRGFVKLNSLRCQYKDEMICGNYHCLKIETQPVKSKKALLFLFGGGYIIGPDAGDLRVASDMGKQSGRDVWFPYYPLCIDHSVKIAFKMGYEVYKKMLSEYEPHNIAILGFSSGGALAIGICLHNNAQPKPLPMPGLIVASSPGSVPLSEEEKRKMAILDEKDLCVSASFMETIREIMEHGENIPEYMLSGVRGNFSNFPLTHFYYGSDEVLYAEAEYFEKAYDNYQAKCVIHVGEGMFHCYPMLPYFREGKAAYKEIIEILKI
jgi:acetyl esterase/lipase